MFRRLVDPLSSLSLRLLARESFFDGFSYKPGYVLATPDKLIIELPRNVDVRHDRKLEGPTILLLVTLP